MVRHSIGRCHRNRSRAPRRGPLRRSSPRVRHAESGRAPDRTGRIPWMGRGGTQFRGDRNDCVERGRWGGLEVDRLGGRIDVMLKPAEGLLSGIPAIAGTIMLGDGQVLFVLDVKEV